MTRVSDNTAAIAAKFGISLKALRLYERLGMLQPSRTKAGWRVYGPADIERLRAILSLKELGLPLAQIATLLKAGVTDLQAVLAMQEQILLQHRYDTDHALSLVQIARTRLKRKKTMSVEAFVTLVRQTSDAVVRWSPEMETLAKRTYTPEQLHKIRGRDRDPRDAARASAKWARLQDAIVAMGPNGDPLSPKGLALGRRFAALVRENTRGDKELWNNSARFWQQAVEDPDIATQLPMNKEHYFFVGQALAELARRGEIKP